MKKNLGMGLGIIPKFFGFLGMGLGFIPKFWVFFGYETHTQTQIFWVWMYARYTLNWVYTQKSQIIWNI